MVWATETNQDSNNYHHGHDSISDFSSTAVKVLLLEPSVNKYHTTSDRGNVSNAYAANDLSGLVYSDRDCQVGKIS